MARRALRWMLLSPLVVIAAVALVLVVLFGAAQTHPGKDWLAGALGGLLSSPGTAVRIEGIDGLVPFDVTVRRLALADPAGPWLTATDLALRWAPSALLGGTLAVEQAVVGRLALARRPAAPPAAEAGADRPALGLPLTIDVARFELTEIALDPAVLGFPARLTLSGRAHVTRDMGRMEIDLDAARRDGVPGTARLRAHWLPEAGRLSLDARVSEPAGGMIAGLLSVPERPPVALEVSGEGPLDDWQGALEARFGAQAGLAATAHITAVPGGHRARVNGSARIAALLPPRFAPLLEDEARFRLDATARAGGPVAVAEARIEAGPTVVRLSGAIDMGAGTVDADVALRADALSRFEALLEERLSGRLEATGAIAGSLAQAEATLDLRAGDMRVADLRAATLSGRLRLSPDRPWLAPGLHVGIEGEGEAERLAIDGMEAMIATLLGDRAGWSAATRLDAGSGTLTFSRMRLEGEAVSAEGDGTLAGDGQRFEARLAVTVADLAALAPLTGLAWSGGLGLDGVLSGDFTRSPERDSVRAEIFGAFQELGTGIAPLGALLGPGPAVAGTITLAPDGALHLQDVVLDGTALSASGSLAMARAGGLDGQVALSVPQLSALAEVLGTQIAGGLSADVRLAGAAADPAFDGTFTGTGIVLGESPAANLSGRFTLNGAARRPHGEIAVRLATAGITGDLSGAYALGERDLSLRDILAEADGLRVEGEAEIPVDGTPPRARLRAVSGDLRPWATRAGIELAGSGEATLTLAPRDGAQGIAATATARGLAGPALDGTLDRLELSADGVWPAFAVRLAAEGAAGPPVQVSADGEVDLEAETLRLDRLDGAVGAFPLALRQPLGVRREGETVVVEGLDLALASGALAADFRLTPAGPVGRVQAEGLSLDALGTGLSGRLDATLEAMRAEPEPEATATLRLNGLEVADSALADLPQVAVTADLRWAQGVVQATGAVSGLTGASARAELSWPMTVVGTPALPEFRAQAPLSGSVALAGDLEQLAALLPLGGDRVAGQMVVEAGIGGTFEQPRLQGSATLREGAYENFQAGTVLRSIEADIEADGERLVLRRLSAVDGGRGTLSGEGGLALDAEAGFPVDMRVTFKTFMVARRDNAEVSASGALRLYGPVRAPTLGGQTTVAWAELRVPERLPRSVVTLDVIEVRDGRVVAAPAPEAEAGLPLALDLMVDLPGQIFVRGRGLTAECRGRLHITGTTEAPLVVGELTLVRGDLSLLGKSLRLASATLSFEEQAPDEPRILVIAEGEGGGVDARITLSGVLSAPTVEIESTPPLPEDEVLARLFFGKSLAELSPLEVAQLADGLATLAGVQTGTGVLETVRQTIGVDLLELRAGEGEATAGTVRAGKYIDERTLLSVEQGVAADSTRATLEVEVTPHISVETDIGADAQGGLGVNIKTDY